MIKRFYTEVSIRIVLITLTAVLLGYVLFKYPDPIVIANVIIAIIVQTILLVKRFDSLKKLINRFFDAVKYDDSGLIVPENSLNKNFAQLNRSLYEINQTINRGKIKLAKQSHYLTTITQNLGAGLISFKRDGEIQLVNKSARELLYIAKNENIRKLDELSQGLSNLLMTMKPSEKKLIKIDTPYSMGERQVIAVAVDFINEGEWERIISLKDIGDEMDSREMQSWQKMISVLNHEVMNTMGPISSSAATMKDIVKEDLSQTIQDTSLIEDLECGLNIIIERSEGLNNFVRGFRSLTKLPSPKKKIHVLEDLLSIIRNYAEEELIPKNIHVQIEKDNKNAQLYIDIDLMRQVLVNILKNASEAFDKKTDARIKIETLSAEDSTILIISDNGPGIPYKILENIFIPFYTTKKEGSGIGLSFSKQVMRMHNGKLLIESKENQGTTVKLVFSKIHNL